MPFDFNTEITYMMEFGNEYIRFYTSGQPVLEPTISVLGFTVASPGVFFIPSHGYSPGDEIVSTAPNMANYSNRQLLVGTVVDANHVTLTDLFGNVINTTGTVFAGPMSTARIYTLASPFLTADLFDLNFVQSADVVTIVHPNYIPQNLSRISASTFQLAPDVPGAVMQPPTGLTGSSSGGVKQNYGYAVTAVSEDGTEESVMSIPVVVNSALLDQTAATPIQITLNWTAPAGLIVSAYNVYKWGPITVSNGTPPTVFGYIGQTQSTSFTDSNIAADFSQVPDQFIDPFSTGQLENITVLTGGAYTAGGSVSYIPLTITGDGTGAAGYGVVDYTSGAIVGAFITTPGKGYTQITISAGTGGATFQPQIGPETGTYPSVVSYIQQRRAYAAPNGDPQGYTMSQTGNYDNFNVSPVVEDSDAITGRLASVEVDFIQSMTPMSTGLVVLTSGGAWLLSGGTPGAPLTPSATTATRQASHGANSFPAIVWNYDVLYMQQKGNTVRDLAFNFYLQSYVGDDRSYLSQHLFTNFNFVQWCAAEEPLKLIWIVRDDGVMLSMTYLPEQQVYGWAHHDTQGLFRSVATVSEGTVDAVYVIVSRYVQPGANCGSGWFDFIERFDDRKFDCTEDVWFLDCALSNEKEFPPFTIFDSGPVSTVGGNVEVCVAPSVNLYGLDGVGKFSPVGAALDYTATSAATTHGNTGIFDWDANILYNFQAWNGSSDPHSPNNNTLFCFNILTTVQIAGPLEPGALGIYNSSKTCLGHDSHIYSAGSSETNLIVRLNTTTFVNDISYDNTNSLADVGHLATIEGPDGEYVLYTGLDSGQGGGGSSPWFVINMTGIGGPAFTGGTGQFDEGVSSIAPDNCYPIRGPLHGAFVLAVGQLSPWTGPVQMGLYLATVGGPTTVSMTKCGAVLATDIDAGWTNMGVTSAVYDETDGNVIVALQGVGNANTYLVKLSTASGAVLWKLLGFGLFDFKTSRIRNGRFSYVNGSTPFTMFEINTLTGTATAGPTETVISPENFSTDDIHGQVVIAINDVGSTMWATFGPQSPTAWATPGQVVQIGCGKIEITGATTPAEPTGVVLTPITNQIPNDSSGATLPVSTGSFSVATPTETVIGLWHLEGKIVMAVADGNVVGPFTVTNGTVTLPHPATNIVVGLAYQAQLQTLYLEAQGPNMQGKRKTIPAATIRVADSRGPKIGRSFDDTDLVEMQGLMVMPGVNPQPLVTGDFREVLHSDWETTGQLCVQQDYPLPLTVLGIIPEFVRGDTAT
jgi:hypothetical protein